MEQKYEMSSIISKNFISALSDAQIELRELMEYRSSKGMGTLELKLIDEQLSRLCLRVNNVKNKL